MYRATAEIVSGSKVFASGKWLKCIGNKRVSVGERIWTDGRCVYGHFQEAQQPHVITGGDEAIPILIYDNDEYKFYTLRKKQIAELPAPEKEIFDGAGYWGFINDNKKNAYVNNKSRALIKFVPMITGPPVEEYHRYEVLVSSWFVYRYTLAVNIDANGNIYEIETDLESHGADVSYSGPREFHTVYIKKNGQILKTLDYKEKLEQIATQVASACVAKPQLSSLFTYTKWAVIENENNWAFTVVFYVSYYDDVDGGINRGGQVCYLCTPTGENEFTLNQPPTNQIPIQDGYFFKINNFYARHAGNPVDGNYYEDPEYMNVSIYTPKNQLLYTGKFPAGTYFTICKSQNFFLLGIDDKNGIGIGLLGQHRRIENNIGNGIFFINTTEQKLELLIEGNVRNWKLRPMKHYKNWHKRIREINLNETA